MILTDFINKNINTKIDFDGAYGAQCVDLFRLFCKEVLRAGHTGAVEGAKDLFLKYEKLPEETKYFKKIKTSEPLPGDVCVWDETAKNKYGHVAICVGVLDNNIIVFEQNGFTQEGAKLNVRSNENMLGVLRFGTSVL